MNLEEHRPKPSSAQGNGIPNLRISIQNLLGAAKCGFSVCRFQLFRKSPP